MLTTDTSKPLAILLSACLYYSRQRSKCFNSLFKFLKGLHTFILILASHIIKFSSNVLFHEINRWQVLVGVLKLVHSYVPNYFLTITESFDDQVGEIKENVYPFL